MIQKGFPIFDCPVFASEKIDERDEGEGPSKKRKALKE